ncbi:MAG: sigma-70 family RNA polymerase sigma factor [Planctomycetia bacterium]|nr:MAG: sigma-70 family RNA polymerase sigma factor [Planctomycetia bacterium]
MIDGRALADRPPRGYQSATRMSDSNPPIPAATLADLAQRAALGEEDAFELIYARLAGGLKRFLTKRCGRRPELVEELAQRAWVELWRALREQRYDPQKAAVTTYLYSLTIKLWLKYARESRLLTASDDVLLGILEPTGAAHPADKLHLAELLETLRQSLSSDNGDHSLTPVERSVVEWTADGIGEREISRRLGLAASTVHAHKHRALEKIRNHLALRGFRGSGAERGEPDAE